MIGKTTILNQPKNRKEIYLLFIYLKNTAGSLEVTIHMDDNCCMKIVCGWRKLMYGCCDNYDNSGLHNQINSA